MRNLSHENELCTQFHFHKNGFALRLALKQRHKGTRKWPILPAASGERQVYSAITVAMGHSP